MNNRIWLVLFCFALTMGLGVAPAQSASLEETFNEVEVIEDGLGPRFNLDSCGGCHIHPSVGRSSPVINPQVALATAANVNAEQLLAFDKILITPAALEHLAERMNRS